MFVAQLRNVYETQRPPIEIILIHQLIFFAHYFVVKMKDDAYFHPFCLTHLFLLCFIYKKTLVQSLLFCLSRQLNLVYYNCLS